MRRILLCLALLSGSAWGHEVKLEMSRQGATVVRLTYADGQPFAFEAYELYLPNKAIPQQVGRTDAQGRVVFLPGTQTDWRLRAYSADGHGVDQTLTAAAATDGSAERSEAGEPPRALLLAAGLGILFGLFGVVQLFLRKKPA